MPENLKSASSNAFRWMIKTGTLGTCSSRGNTLCDPHSSEGRRGLGLTGQPWETAVWQFPAYWMLSNTPIWIQFGLKPN